MLRLCNNCGMSDETLQKGNKRGRKKISTYKTEMCEFICALISSGKALHTIAGTTIDEIKIPQYHTLSGWLVQYPEFSQAYARAREIRTEKFAEEIIEIADDDKNDYGYKEDGTACILPDNVRRSTLRVDARKWIASKMLPGRYGDKQSVEHSGQVEHIITHKIIHERGQIAD